MVGPAIDALLERLPHYRAFPEKHVLLDNSDLDALLRRPRGHLFKTSANYRLTDILPLHYNVPDPGPSPPIAHARFDVSFQGSITTSPVRQSMNLWRYGWTGWRIHFRAVEPYWTLPADARTALARSYTESVRASRFALCPRGRGLNSRRFFETLALGRIPVLYGDAARLPLENVIPWDRFVVRVPEGFGRWTPDFVEAFLARNDLEEASQLARNVWLQYFAPSRFRHFLVAALSDAGALWRRQSPTSAELSPLHVRHLKILPSRDDIYDVLPKHAVVAELGVGFGVNARSILQRARPQVLHLVDLWPENRADCRRAVQQQFADDIREGRVVMHRGDDLQVLETFPDAYFDWVYLDSSHQYAHTRRELELLDRKLKPQGILCGHDYVNHDVNLIDRGEHAWYRLKQCVNEFCIRHRWEFIYLTMECASNPSFAIRRIRT